MTTLTFLPLGAFHSPFMTTPKDPFPSFSFKVSSESLMRQVRSEMPAWWLGDDDIDWAVACWFVAVNVLVLEEFSITPGRLKYCWRTKHKISRYDYRRRNRQPCCNIRYICDQYVIVVSLPLPPPKKNTHRKFLCIAISLPKAMPIYKSTLMFSLNDFPLSTSQSYRPNINENTRTCSLFLY